MINFIAFETGWFAAVLGAAPNYLWSSISIAGLVMSHRPRREFQLLLIVLLLGTAWDSALASAGIIRYSNG